MAVIVYGSKGDRKKPLNNLSDLYSLALDRNYPICIIHGYDRRTTKHKGKDMNQIEITKGSRKVIAFRNSPAHRWHARLYVNNGETATLTVRTFKTDKGLKKWADTVLTR